MDSLFALLYILCSFVNDEIYMSTMGVGSNNSHWSQTNEMHFDDHEFEVDGDGEDIVNALKGRGAPTPWMKTSCYAILSCKCRGIRPLEGIEVDMHIGSG